MSRGALMAAALLAACGEPPRAPPRVDAHPPARDTGADAAPASTFDAAVGEHLWNVAPGADRRTADGSRAHPFPTVNEAYAQARPGDVVVLLAGRHRGVVAPPAGVELLGLGPETTVVEGPLRLDVEGARVGGFTVSGGEPGVEIAASASLEDLRVESARGAGLRVGAEARLRRVTVVDAAGVGVIIELGATVDWEGGGVSGASEQGVISEAATITLSDLLVERTASMGVHLTGGVATLLALRVEATTGAGVRLERVEATVRNLAVRGVVFDEALTTGNGLGVLGGVATVDGLGVWDAGDRGVRITQGATVELRGVEIHGAATTGLAVVEGATATVDGLTVDGPGSGGVSAIEAHLVLRDARISGHQRQELIVSESVFDAQQIDVRGSRARGISLRLSEGRLADCTVADNADVGVQITDPAGPIRVERCVIAGNGTSGVAVDGPPVGEIALVDLDVSGTTIGEGDLGEGVHLYRSDVLVSRLVAHENARAGLRVEASVAQVTDSRFEANGDAGVAVLDTPLPDAPLPDAPPPNAIAGVYLEGNVAIGNHGAGFLFANARARLIDNEARLTLPSPVDGTAEGVAGLVRADLDITGGRYADNGANGIYLWGLAHARVEGASLTGNGGYGAFAACDGSQVDFRGDNELADNALGPRNHCP